LSNQISFEKEKKRNDCIHGQYQVNLENAVAQAQPQQQRRSNQIGFNRTARNPPKPHDPEELAAASSITITRGSFARVEGIPCLKVADL
jgi:hypothetical protein